MKDSLKVFLGICLLVNTIIATPWGDPSDTPAQRAQALLSEMTNDEKFAMVHGYSGPYVGNVAAIPRLGIPSINLEDGPQGVADGVTQVTAWPSALTVVATWDQQAMIKWGQAMGYEQLGKGTNVMLGPMINLARVPQGGRNFESFGEDPYLASQMVRASVQGIQSTGVMACAKHFVDNNQEYQRGSISEDVPQRAQYELYYEAFRASVQAGVASFMCSYNKINNTYACENPQTLAALHDYMGFQGFIMSDWGGTHSTVASANAGLDMEMPGADYFGTSLQQAVANGSVPQSRVDNMVLRILTAMFQVGIFDRQQTGNLGDNVMSDEHNQLARDLAIESTVLLKNDGGILPLDPASLKTIAVIGDDAMAAPIATGCGSGGVVLPYLIDPLSGIRQRLGYTRAQNCTYEQNIDYYQPGNPSKPANSPEECCTVCYQTAGCNYFTWTSDNTCWLKPSNAGRKDASGLTSGSCGTWQAGNITVNYANSSDLNAAAALAKSADVAIVFVATTSCEGSDRANLSLNWPSDDLVSTVVASQPKTIVVIHSPGAVTMPWQPKVPAIVEAWLPGQEDGNAIAAILFGDANPGARLPVSFPHTDNDTWLLTPEQYPGVNGHANYSENLQMGYRWWSSQGTAPLYGFGYGLSYTTFSYSGLSIQGVGGAAPAFTVIANVTNTGKRAGAEVAQLYLTFPSVAQEPPEILKGFERVYLNPGQSVLVSFQLSSGDLSYWDVVAGNWTIARGTFTAYVGPYWRNYPLKGTFDL